MAQEATQSPRSRLGATGTIGPVDAAPWRPTVGNMGHYTDIITELKGPTRSLRKASGDTWAGFAALHQAAVAEGVVPARIKELIALAIAVVKECDGCIAYHAKAAARRGATAEEVAEVLGVTLLMDGGPASVNAPRAWAAFSEFAEQVPASDGSERR